MTKPTTALITLGDVLKSETDRMTREVITAPPNTKMGDLVDYPPRGKKLVALSDEQGGKVLVQPHNCTIDLDFVNLAGTDAQTLIQEGEAHGIKYLAQTQEGGFYVSGQLTTLPPISVSTRPPSFGGK